jgi:hypothetical protein
VTGCTGHTGCRGGLLRVAMGAVGAGAGQKLSART